MAIRITEEPKRWRETLPLVIVAEDIPIDKNHVAIDKESGQASVTYLGPSDYARKGLDKALNLLPDILDPLPVEAIHFSEWRRTESRVQGTLKMGVFPDDSVVDANLIHHQYRNLIIVGTAVFPSCSCANPSLTAAALSLRSAQKAL